MWYWSIILRLLNYLPMSKSLRLSQYSNQLVLTLQSTSPKLSCSNINRSNNWLVVWLLCQPKIFFEQSNIIFSQNKRIQLTSMDQTAPLWPLKDPNRSPFNEYHTFGCGSFAQLKMRSPCLLYLIWVIDLSWPWSIMGFWNSKKSFSKYGLGKRCFIIYYYRY